MAVGRSHLFSQLRGSVGGITYTQNSYATIVARNRTTPTNPNTARQIVVRGYLSTAVNAWQARSTIDRQSWHDYAQQTPWTNALGEDIRLSAFNMYCAVRCAAKDINPGLASATWDNPPSTPGLLPNPYCELLQCSSFPPGTLCYEYRIHNLSDTETIRCKAYRSSLMPVTINWFKGPYPASNTTINLAPGASHLIVYGGGAILQKVFVRLRSVDAINWNRISSAVYFTVDGSYS